MKKSLLILVLAVLCMQAPCAALGAETPETLVTYEMPETGFLPGAAIAGDGVLLTGIPADKEIPWAALFDSKGAQQWLFTEAAGSVSQYLCPACLEDGSYTVLRESYSGDGSYEYTRLSLDANGKLLGETPLWPNTLWMIPHGEETYTLGYYSDNGDQYPQITLQNSLGIDSFSYYYTVDGCTSAAFEKGCLTQDALILSGRGVDTQFDQSAGLLYMIDLEGNVLWGATTTAESPNEFIYANDVCVTGDGQIIWICTTVTGDEDDDYPIGRSSTVYCLDMDGEILWTYETPADDMLEYVAPVSGGFLLGSRGLDLEYSPDLGQGWLLLLTADGQESPETALPQMGGGSMELLGITANTEDSVLCYGLLLEDVGYPDKPFSITLAFPRADE